jgi:hypothetical protein
VAVDGQLGSPNRLDGAQKEGRWALIGLTLIAGSLIGEGGL